MKNEYKNKIDTKKELLILVYSDDNYKMFVLPYIYYALIHNTNTFVEIILDDADSFKIENQKGIEYLQSIFLNSFLIRQSKYKKGEIVPNTIRFLDEAHCFAKYLYIGDIDLLIFEDIKQVHLNLIDKYELPFSNIIRKQKLKKLTGLHFCEYNKYYPLPDLSDVDLKMTNDEHVLYLIMKRNGYMVPDSFSIRPLCGIHMSLSRDIVGRYWLNDKIDLFSKDAIGWDEIQIYKIPYMKSLCNEKYFNLIKHLDISYRYLSLLLESFIKNKLEELQKTSLKYGVNKQLVQPFDKISFADLEQKRKEYISKQEFKNAENINKSMILQWPDKSQLYIDLINNYVLMGNINAAEKVFKFIINLPNARSYCINSKTDLSIFLITKSIYFSIISSNYKNINKWVTILERKNIPYLQNICLDESTKLEISYTIDEYNIFVYQILFYAKEGENFFWKNLDIKNNSGVSVLSFSELNKVGNIEYKEIDYMIIRCKKI